MFLVLSSHPIAISSTTSQDRILELFNLGVADVLLKPIEEQAARTLFLVCHASWHRWQPCKGSLLSVTDHLLALHIECTPLQQVQDSGDNPQICYPKELSRSPEPH